MSFIKTVVTSLILMTMRITVTVTVSITFTLSGIGEGIQRNHKGQSSY
ncbi:hypothetical protein VCHC17A1_3900 [Vibrio cholerae HC-17A1]|nr:hypothetical protein VCHC17A1_3900 [Vibrio cholerae HC-17A1]